MWASSDSLFHSQLASEYTFSLTHPPNSRSLTECVLELMSEWVIYWSSELYMSNVYESERERERERGLHCVTERVFFTELPPS